MCDSVVFLYPDDVDIKCYDLPVGMKATLSVAFISFLSSIALMYANI